MDQCAGCVRAIQRPLSAVSDEVAAHADPRLKNGIPNQAWNVEIMAEAIDHLREHGARWDCAQRATAALLAEHARMGA